MSSSSSSTLTLEVCNLQGSVTTIDTLLSPTTSPTPSSLGAAAAAALSLSHPSSPPLWRVTHGDVSLPSDPSSPIHVSLLHQVLSSSSPLVVLPIRKPPSPPALPIPPGPPPSMDDVMRVTSIPDDDLLAEGKNPADLAASVASIATAFAGFAHLDTGDTNTLPSPDRIVLRPPEVDPDALGELTAMGFPHHHATRALIVARNRMHAAMEYLLQAGGSDELDAPLSQDELARYGGVPDDTLSSSSSSSSLSSTAAASSSSAAAAAAAAAAASSSSSLQTQVPDPRIQADLLQMGFDAQLVDRALLASQNRYQIALGMLLGDIPIPDSDTSSSSPSSSSSPQTTITPSSPVIQALVRNPAVLDGLSDPTVLAAVQEILADPSSAGDLINDPNIGPFLLHIHGIVRQLQHPL